ncbi:MAG TPA: hypothetical protein VK166_16880, partial [Chitinophagaceae bacterium]|nr:hypothetical protein [Chitinophagaceae bacterium]
MKRITKLTAIILFLVLAGFIANAQMPADGFTMSKGEICLVTDYGQSSWKEYWEGTRLRENLNL